MPQDSCGYLEWGTRCWQGNGYTPLAVLKIKDSSTAPGHMIFPQICLGVATLMRSTEIFFSWWDEPKKMALRFVIVQLQKVCVHPVVYVSDAAHSSLDPQYLQTSRQMDWTRSTPGCHRPRNVIQDHGLLWSHQEEPSRQRTAGAPRRSPGWGTPNRSSRDAELYFSMVTDCVLSSR